MPLESMDFHLYVHFVPPEGPDLAAALALQSERISAMAATLDDLVTQVQTQTGTVASMSTFIQGLETQIRDALAGVTLSPEAQAKVDSVFTALQQNTQQIADAIDNDPNTPPQQQQAGGEEQPQPLPPPQP